MALPRGPLETLIAQLNALKAPGLIGEHAIGGAMAFIYWAEPFETKDLDVFAVPASNTLDEEAIADAVPVTVSAETTRVFTPEHAVAIALRTWRGKDREHIDRLIHTGRRPLEMPHLHGILQRHGLEEKWRRFREMYDVDLG